MLNQENKADNGKHDPTLLMHDLGKALKAVTAVLNYGAEKYEPRGWKTVEPRRYQSALLRHYNDHYIMGELTDNESGLLHLAHKATNALFLLQLHIENAEKSSKTPPDFYTYKKPPQNHKKIKAPKITGTFRAPDYTSICKEPYDYTYVHDYGRKAYEKQAEHPAEDAFDSPADREFAQFCPEYEQPAFQIPEGVSDFPSGLHPWPEYDHKTKSYYWKCCNKTVLKRCKGCPHGVKLPKARIVCSNDCYFNPECGGTCPYGR